MMELHQRQALFCQNVCHLIEYLFQYGLSCTFGEAYRSPEQAQIDAHKGTGIANSLHCKRLAIDLNLFDANGIYLSKDSDAYEAVGKFWKGLHPDNRWGGNFKRVDLNHFEMTE